MPVLPSNVFRIVFDQNEMAAESSQLVDIAAIEESKNFDATSSL